MTQFKRAQVVLTTATDNTTIVLNSSLNKLTLTSKTVTSNYSTKDWLKLGFKVYNLAILSEDKLKEGDYLHYFTYANGHIIKQVKEVKDDWVICTDNECLFKEYNYKKVIAITDISLKPSCTCTESASIYCDSKCQKPLPQPSQQFIEKYIESYNKGEAITDVVVEYETLYDIELLVDTKDFPKGSFIRGKCSTTNEFSKAKKRFLELHTDGNLLSIANANNSIKALNKEFFKEVEFTELKINPKDNSITIKKVKENWNREEVKLLLWTLARGLIGNTIKANDKDTEEWIEKVL